MKWVTRARPKTDRIACPWLIRKFIDQDAKIVFLPPEQVVHAANADPKAHSFDAAGADYTHDGSLCSFEVLIRVRLAEVVHAADVSEDLGSDALGPGLLAIGIGGLDGDEDDQRLLERGRFVHDALYAWCRREVGGESVGP